MPDNLCAPPGPADVDAAAEVFETLLSGQGSWKLERILSHGQASPEGFCYDQETAEWVLLTRGRATLEFEDGETVPLLPGDHLVIPARRKHRVAEVSPDAVWLALHFSAAEGPATFPG